MSKMFVVEDNELNMERIERYLRKLGASDLLVRARDGQDALDRIAGLITKQMSGTSSCVVLVDLNMPRVSGFELIDHIRDNEWLRHLPVYVCPTSDHERDVNDADERDVAGYIVKPITLEQVSGLVELVRSRVGSAAS